MAFYIVLLGPPGAGKGTQAQVITQEMNLPHISTGELFRENFKNGTELGKIAREFIDRGELVPDDITLAMVRQRLSAEDCSRGALMDGFPRTLAQAKAFDELLEQMGSKVHAVPYIHVAEEELVERLSGRLTCRAEGHVFHKRYNPPSHPEKCDFDDSALYQRDDDRPETVKNRIKVFYQQTSPLIEYYRQQGKLMEIDGMKSVEEVSAEVLEKMHQIKAGG